METRSNSIGNNTGTKISKLAAAASFATLMAGCSGAETRILDQIATSSQSAMAALDTTTQEINDGKCTVVRNPEIGRQYTTVHCPTEQDLVLDTNTLIGEKSASATRMAYRLPDYGSYENIFNQPKVLGVGLMGLMIGDKEVDCSLPLFGDFECKDPKTGEMESVNADKVDTALDPLEASFEAAHAAAKAVGKIPPPSIDKF